MSQPLGPTGRGLVLLVDNDVESRRGTRHLLEGRGMDVVQASNGMAALELIQRLPESFRLVITDLDLPGISGAMVVETLRIFRPDLPVFCLSGARVEVGVDIKSCLSKPVQSTALDAALERARNGWKPLALVDMPDAAIRRARARFDLGRDLVEAALELARGAKPEM